jgi:hypothetical protein
VNRRAFLAACSAGIGGLAGCNRLSTPGSSEEPDVDTRSLAAEFEPVAPPEAPFTTAALTERVRAHEQRASELLADVPADPSIPNEAVSEQFDAERPETTPAATPPADESAMRWLDEWRSYRSRAAKVWGIHRAATGIDDSTLVTERRHSVRQGLGTVRADMSYLGPDPIAAAVNHAPIEDLLRESHNAVQPRRAFPDDPITAPFRAGDVIGRIERARGALADARELLPTDGDTNWETLASSAGRLRHSLARTTDGLEPYVQRRTEAFGFELTGTDRWLFREGVNALEFQRRDAREAHDDGRYATAIVETGQALVSAELLSAVVTGIRDGRYPDEPSADDIREAAAGARTALTDRETTADAGLAEALGRPAVFRQRGVIEEMADGYRDNVKAYAGFTHAAMHARGVPAAAEYIVTQVP